jgi:YD repeat-containing protein
MGRVLVGAATSGRAERFERDERGRLRTVSFPDGLVERLSFDSRGRVASTSNNRGMARQFAYDSQGHLARVRMPVGLDTSLSYDAVGRLTGSANNLGETLAITYDSRGLVESVRRGSGLTRYERDPAGRLSAVTGPLGSKRKLEYDLAGDLVAVTEESGDTTRFSYAEDGSLDRMVLPGGGVVELSYDPMGNLVSERNPAGRQRLYTYDSAGRLTQQTDALGRVTKFIYYPSGLLAQKQLPDGTKIEYGYDDNGWLSRVDDGIFPVGFGYDELGRRNRIEYPKLDRVIRMDYTEGGLLSRVSDPDRGAVAYEYDENGRLASIRINGEAPFHFSFDAADRLIGIGYPNGVAGFQEYGPDGNVDSIRYVAPAGKVLAGWNYEYDAAGNPLTEKDASGAAITFRYDQAGRLIGESGEGGEVRYSYAAAGNRAVREDSKGRTEYDYDAANRLVRAGAIGYSYDPNGNLIEKRGPSGTTRFQYDVQEQLVAVTSPDGEIIRFGYSPTGERIWREDSEGRIHYLSDGTHVLAELDGNKELRVAYLHGPGIDQPLLMLRGGQRSYLHSRLLGTVAAVSGADGKVSDRFDIDCFGRVTGRTRRFPSCSPAGHTIAISESTTTAPGTTIPISDVSYRKTRTGVNWTILSSTTATSMPAMPRRAIAIPWAWPRISSTIWTSPSPISLARSKASKWI